MTFEDYTALDEDARLEYAVTQALGVMSAAEAVIVTDDEGRHWQVDPQDILPSAEGGISPSRGQTTGFAEDPAPFDRGDD